MRILFTVLGNSRRSNYLDGNTLRYGNGGGSGTDTSSIIAAEQLAIHGHEVVVCTEQLEPKLEEAYAKKGIFPNPGKKVRNVVYTNFKLDGVDNKTFDVLVNSLWFSDYKNLPVKITKAVIYWCHMQWIYGIGELQAYAKENNLKIGFVHISEWEKEMNTPVVSSTVSKIPSTLVTTIPNPIMDDIIEEVLKNPPNRKPHKVVFHAAWARGGNIALQAVRELGWKDVEFHAFDYLMATHDHKDPFFYRHDAVDKKTLFNNIAESEYFIYPLYTPYQDVHKDTFSCVVAEAIALGAVVITYPLGALPEYYNEYCQWLDFPPNTDPVVMQKEPLSKDLDGKFKYTNNIIQKINYLESNPEIKLDIRNRGKNHILKNFNSNKIGDMWDAFVKKLIYEN